jgi:alpha-mannosidase
MADTVGQVPRVHSGGTVDDFFDRLEEKASCLVTWYGELYFELHRGVYTTQANTKLKNRKSEFLLRDIELLATIASIQDSSYQYPKKELDEMWEGVLLCQFHDCLPGSAIKMCYDDSNQVSVLGHKRIPKRSNFLRRFTLMFTKSDMSYFRKST